MQSSLDDREKLLCYLDVQQGGPLRIRCPEHGPVAELNTGAIVPIIPFHGSEGDRRVLMYHAFRLAGVVESITCSDVLMPSPVSPLVDVRMQPGVESLRLFDDYREWWEEHRGWLRLRCERHGPLMRVDASRSPGMIAALWDGVVSERMTERENVWSRSGMEAVELALHGPSSPICRLKIVSEQDPPAEFPPGVLIWWPFPLE